MNKLVAAVPYLARTLTRWRCPLCRRVLLAKALAASVMLPALRAVSGSVAAVAFVPAIWLVEVLVAWFFERVMPDGASSPSVQSHWLACVVSVCVTAFACEVLLLVRVVGLSWVLVYLTAFAGHGIGVAGAVLVGAWGRARGTPRRCVEHDGGEEADGPMDVVLRPMLAGAARELDDESDEERERLMRGARAAFTWLLSALAVAAAGLLAVPLVGAYGVRLGIASLVPLAVMAAWFFLS
jgi:hypothetical protein